MVSHSRHDHESHIAPVLVSENGQQTHSIGTVDESSEPEAGVREDLLSDESSLESDDDDGMLPELFPAYQFDAEPSDIVTDEDYAEDDD